MENYIVINGRKAELTEEQLRALGIEVNESPFNRVKTGDEFYYISFSGSVISTGEVNSNSDNLAYKVANYCTDKELLQQQAYRETLNRLLWRYSMEHDGDKINWDWDHIGKPAHYIYYSYTNAIFVTGHTTHSKSFERVYFYTKEIAKNAIKEIVEPFIAEHPDFKW